ncbi:DUF3343 domain-containing protein [Vagococcus zengguangii]|uniref:DUF3343 domain-containing protein n=1 Tax=Vagococcus zengguangii TaxID=2571750 RepID=A0A4D7CTZ7_9ENTE|nr:DUF3343 domain-containing protein [Vagococcus zengguangii]QCI86442.1 DUF3343 domain-containing protein [Vagococcus zengguangii]TLG81308.1 DUF3343 domain-containing protein [Vagococcus zengguangii]
MEYLVLYKNIKEAIQAEEWLRQQDIKVRIIATPESIEATCGFSLELITENLEEALAKNHSSYAIKEIYMIQGERLNKRYNKLEVRL